MRIAPLAAMMMALSLMSGPVLAQSQAPGQAPSQGGAMEKGTAGKSAEHEKETPVQLSQVPEAAMNAAQQALGTTPTSAAMLQHKEHGQQVYELEAKTPQGESAVHVTADGKVLKHEQGKE